MSSVSGPEEQSCQEQKMRPKLQQFLPCRILGLVTMLVTFSHSHYVLRWDRCSFTRLGQEKAVFVLRQAEQWSAKTYMRSAPADCQKKHFCHRGVLRPVRSLFCFNFCPPPLLLH